MKAHLQRRGAGYFAAVAATAVAVFFRWLLDPVAGDFLPLATLYGAVAFAVWLGGYRPALLACVAGYLACDFLFIQPRGRFGFADPHDVLGLLLYVGSCLIVIVLGEAMLRAQRRAEELAAAQHQNEQLLAAIFEQSPVGIGLMDADGRWRMCNAIMRRFIPDQVPSRDEDAIGRWRALKEDGSPLEPENWPAARALRGELASPGTEFVHTTVDGCETWVRLAATPFRNAQGAVAGAVAVAQDVTEQRRAKAAIEAARQQLQIVTDSMSAPVTRCSRDLRYLWASKAYAEWLGRSPDEIIGRPIVDVLGPEAFAQLRPHFEQVLAGAKAAYEDTVEYRGLGPRRINAIYTPTLDATGIPDGWVALVLDVTEQRRLELALKEADQRKDEFLATLAHELRNPLAPLRFALELLIQAEGNTALIEDARSVMERQVGHLVRLVDDLLDVSRITQGKLYLRKELVKLADVLSTATETARPLVEASHHQLSVVLPPDPIYVQADSIRLAQTFVNLLNNAAKYTEKGGHIWLTAEPRNGEVMVSVRDTGIGIAAEHLQSIFRMFSQLSPASERAQGGLGIGLSLAKGLVELHGGTIEASSEGLGQGSKFTVHLPVVPGPRYELPPAEAPGDEVHEQSCRVLVVDDLPDAADCLAKLLRAMGHETFTAYDGLEAVEVGAAFKPDLILMDLGMPNLNGFDACRRIREQPWGKEIVIAAVTGWGQEEDRRRTFEAGFDHHFTKPLAVADLESLLSRVVPEPLPR
ncbi:MAG TPA: PAS domain-containing protein [Pirellulales bacterium]|nr:PAS domain-containing protein [Pirellulales bacterium]